MATTWEVYLVFVDTGENKRIVHAIEQFAGGRSGQTLVMGLDEDKAALKSLASRTRRVRFHFDDEPSASWALAEKTSYALYCFLETATTLTGIVFRGPWAAPFMTRILTACSVQLEELYLLDISSTNEGLHGIEDAISCLFGLKVFRMHITGNVQEKYLSTLQRMFSSVAALEKVEEFTFIGNAAFLCHDGFKKLLVSPSLRNVSFSLLDPNALVPLLRDLNMQNKTTSFTHLSVQSAWTGQALIYALDISRKLKSLTVRVRDLKKQDGRLRNIFAVLSQSKTTLKSMTLEKSTAYNPRQSSIVGKTMEMAIVDMLDKNLIFEEVSLKDFIISAGLRRKIKYYTSLNKAGRSRFLKDDTFTDMQRIETLVSLEGNLSFVFDLLSNRPGLIASAVPFQSDCTPAAENPRKRKRLHRAAKNTSKRNYKT